MSNLKPCPFCGSKKVEYFEAWEDEHYVGCHFCKTTGPLTMDKEKAIERWNNRHKEAR